MKRFLLMAAACALVAAAAPSALAVPTYLGPGDALSWTFLVAGTLSDGAPLVVDTDGFLVYKDVAITGVPTYTDTQPLAPGGVGFSADGVGKNGATRDYISVGGTTALTPGTTVAVRLHNDNNQDWDYRMFADDGSGTYWSGPWQLILVGHTEMLMVDIPASAAMGDYLVGFQVGARDKVNSVHTSVVVPAPGAVLLSSIGIGLVGWMRRRRAL